MNGIERSSRTGLTYHAGATVTALIILLHHGLLGWVVKQTAKPIKWAAKTTVNKVVKPAAKVIITKELTQSLPIKTR